MTLPQIAAALRTRLGDRAAQVPDIAVSDDEFLAEAAHRPELEVFAGLLGEPKRLRTTKATEMLGWQPRSALDAVTATAESLLALSPA